MTSAINSIAQYVDSRVEAAVAGAPLTEIDIEDNSTVADDSLLQLFEAQLKARYLDLYARDLQQQGEGFYTIGSLGHESNAAVALSLHPSDPALLHYRSAGFFCARAARYPELDPVRDMLLSYMASAKDPISGGRHKVFGSKTMSIIPQTSTIASHLPRAVGLAFGIDRLGQLESETELPTDAIVVASLGDASLNHSTAMGALNAAQHASHQGVAIPLLVVVEDNGIGISVRTPDGWVEKALKGLHGLEYFSAHGSQPVNTLRTAERAIEYVRSARQPAVLHLRTVRYMGHAGSDAEIAYRSHREIREDFKYDPLLATASVLLSRSLMTPADLRTRIAETRHQIALAADALLPTPRLATADEVVAPLNWQNTPTKVEKLATAEGPSRDKAFRGRLPEHSGPLTLGQTINATLTDIMAAYPNTLAFGEDIGVKGGVYGITRGLRRAFGVRRVFDTLLDEQTVLGTALGTSLAGFLPIPEIQYLAYVHNAIDQIRGEAATLSFFSNRQYTNGMVVRIAGLAYQRGFGGHFHNDNSVAALLDIPGIVVGVPSSAEEASGILRMLVAMAKAEGRVGVFLEPIALYHNRDIFPGDGAARALYLPPSSPEAYANLPKRDQGRLHVLEEEEHKDVLVVSFGNGVGMSYRAIKDARVAADVYDLRWLSPLPSQHLAEIAEHYPHVLIVDETRKSGGVSEAVITALNDYRYTGTVRRVTSVDSIIPLGPAAEEVLLKEEQIVAALKEISKQDGREGK